MGAVTSKLLLRLSGVLLYLSVSWVTHKGGFCEREPFEWIVL
jgi:hypothetical protein